MSDNHMDNLANAVNSLSKIVGEFVKSNQIDEEDKTSSIAKYYKESDHSTVNEKLQKSPIAELLADDGVSDILINGPFEVYVDSRGKLYKTEVKFKDHIELLELADAIANSLNRRIDRRRPVMDARLPDGSRVNIIAPPMAVDGLSMSIRKFGRSRITLDKLVEYDSMNTQMCEFLKACATCGVNIIISGGTGSGKTTLLNAISEHIPATERIVSVEDSIELKLQQPHVVRLETKIPEVAGDRTREVNIRDLVVNSLRMRPDRIVIGEVRSSEAYDMIQAMNTGHDGSMATLHANNPREAISRMEGMISQVAHNTPLLAIRRQIVSAVNFIIQVNRFEDGSRKVNSIAEIMGIEGDTPTIHDIFLLKTQGVDPEGRLISKHVWSGSPPKHEKLAAYIRSKGILKTGDDLNKKFSDKFF